MSSLHAHKIFPVNENTLTISLGNSIDLSINKKAFQLYNALLKQRHASWLDIIPAYSTVSIVYDLIMIRQHHTSAFQWMKSRVEEIIEEIQEETSIVSRRVKIPVCYDNAFAPDAEGIALGNKIRIEEVSELHSSQPYHVFMIGFLPGFPYMGSVNPRIAFPRLSTPRTLVPAGSVGIAGEQTGIYPLDSPGGWNIIGKTPFQIFNPKAENPVLLQPGDEVLFVPITKAEFESFNPSTFKFIQDER